MYTKSLLIVALCVLPASFASASILRSGLTFNSEIDRVEDDSVGLIISDNGTLDAGDLIQGVIQIGTAFPDDFTLNPPGSVQLDHVLAYYSFEVVSVSGTRVVLGPASGSANVVSIASAVGLSDLSISAADAAKAAILVVEKAGVFNFNSLNATAGFVSGGTVANVISGAAGYVTDMIIGFDGIDDFHDLELADASYTTFANIPTTPNVKIADFKDGLSILANIYGAAFGGIATTDFDGNPVTGDFVSTGATSVISTPLPSEAARGFTFNDDGDFLVNPLPEPVAFLVWVGLFLAGSPALIRRRSV